MRSNEQAAQKARADSLRRQIAEVTGREGVSSGDSSADQTSETARPSPPKESPRHFVQRKMRELDKGRTS